jgi:aminoglycoside phosphotransferase (APT) family kinase protein
VQLADFELRAGLEGALAAAGFALTGEIERRPSANRTSFPIERVRVELEDRGEVTLAFKQLDWDRLEPAARLAKPRFLHDPAREPAVYRHLLKDAPPGPPLYFGSLLAVDRHCLFVEWVEGRELFQVGERNLWEEAARWLGRFHAAAAPEVDEHRRAARLLDHDAAFYRGWMERARKFAGAGSRLAQVEWLGARHEEVVGALLSLPRTVLHGEFYASNVLLADAAAGVRVAPVDWELAAVGSGLSDLAALVAGWPDADREALAAAYAGAPGVAPFSSRELQLARLQVAIQWLGWAPPEWEPPEGQRHDWLAEALVLAEELGL